MAETVAGSLVYKFSADVSSLRKGAQDAAAQVRTMANEVAGASSKMRQGFEETNKALNDNQKAMGLNRLQALELAHVSRSLFDEMAAGGSVFRGLAMEGGRISQILSAGQGGVAGTMAALGAIAVRWLPLVGAVAGVAGVGLLAMAGSHVQDELAALGEQMRKLGLRANELEGAKILGAKFGVGAEEMTKALVSANQQLEQFRRNAGDVKDRVELIDKGFLKTLDTARNLPQFIDILAQKVKALPKTEGLDLVQALFGDDTGEKLYAPLMRGQIGVQQFAAAAKAAGIDIKDGLVDKFVDLQREVDAAEAKASGKFKSAMQDIAELVADLKKKWFDFVEGISAAVSEVGKLYNQIKSILSLPTSPWAKPATRGGIGWETTGQPFGPYQESNAPLPPSRPGGLGNERAGASRARYKGYEDAQSSSGSGTSQIETYLENLKKAEETAKAELDTWKLGNVDRAKAVALAGAESAARKEGRDLTEQERQKVVELSTAAATYKQRLDEIKAAQQALNQAVQEWSNSFIDALDQVIVKGGKVNDVLKSLVQTLASSSLKSLLTGALTGQGFFGQALGLAAPTGSGQMGGLLGSLLSRVSLPKFADGGTLGAGKWGIAGEAGPELVQGPANMVPLGKSSAPKVTIHNYAAGVNVAPQITPQGVALIVRSAIEQNNAKQSQRGWRST